MRLQLGEGATRNRQEAGELARAETAPAFRYVRRHRNRGASHLERQPVLLDPGESVDESMAGHSQIHSLAPDDQVPIASYRHPVHLRARAVHTTAATLEWAHHYASGPSTPGMARPVGGVGIGVGVGV